VPRVCTICSHQDVHQINEALVTRIPLRTIASQYGVSYAAVQRHTKEHLPQLLLMAANAERAARADSLLDRIEALQRRTEEALTKAGESEDTFATFRGISEMRRNLELIGEITKELDRKPTLNLSTNPEWLSIRAVLVGSLEGHPEARERLLKALEGNGNGIP
jgi:hypothetical protein